MILFGSAKAPGLDRSQTIHISNIELFAIDQSRGFHEPEMYHLEFNQLYNASAFLQKTRIMGWVS